MNGEQGHQNVLTCAGQTTGAGSRHQASRPLQDPGGVLQGGGGEADQQGAQQGEDQPRHHQDGQGEVHVEDPCILIFQPSRI